MRIRRIVSGAAAVGLVAGLFSAMPPAEAADPPGTVVLATGLSAFASHGRVVTASAAGAVLTYGPVGAGGGEGNPFLHSVFVPTTGPAVVLDPSVDWSLQGSMLAASTYTTGPVVMYRSVSGAVSGSQPLADTDQFVGATPTGWLVRRDVTNVAGTTTHLIVTKAADLTTTDLGAIPGFDPSLEGLSLATGPIGVSVEVSDGLTTAYSYVPYATPHTFSSLLPPASTNSCSEVAVGTNAAAWLETPDNGTTTQLVRVQLATKVVQRTDLAANFCSGSVEVTPTQTGVEYSTNDVNQLQAFATVAAAGGAVQIRTDLTYPSYAGFAAQGANFLVVNGTTPLDAGVYKLATASATPTLVRLWGQSPLSAGIVAVGPGRVAWTDNSTTSIPAWSRTLTSSGAGLTAGAPSLVAAHSTTFGLSVSGQRTLFVVQDIASGSSAGLWLSRGSAAATLVVTEPNGIATATLSGTRVLYSDYTGAWHLFDLVKGTNKKLAKVGAGAYALSGNSLAAVRTDGSVWWEDITGGGWVQVLAPPTDVFSYGLVAVAGDEVAWVVSTCGQIDCVSSAAHRNARVLSPPVALPAAANAGTLAMSSSYVVYWDFSSGSLLATTVAGGVTTTVADAPPFGVTVSGSTLGWPGSDGLPRATPLAAVPDRPRYLGNGYAPTVVASGQPWTVDLVTSAPLTSCQVVVKKGTTTVRTLPCDAALMAQGEALATWDGRDGSGTTVALGKYKWQVTAANADGSLLAANGTATAIGTAITVQ